MLTINGAGSTASDPILKDLGIKLAAGASTMDIAGSISAWIDQAAGFPGTTSITANLSPDPTTVFLAGTTGAYDNGTGQLNVGDTTGLAAGDAIYLDHAAITNGIYLIASVVNATDITIENDPFVGANRTNVAFQIAYVYDAVTGTSPVETSGAGQVNYFKFQGDDDAAQTGQGEDSFYVRTEPAGSLFIAIDGGDYTGQTVSDPSPSLVVLSGWTSKGGIATVEITSASGVEWGDGGVAERTLTSAETAGLSLTGGDGLKTATLRFRAKQGSAVFKDVAISVTLDTTGPTIVLAAFAR